MPEQSFPLGRVVITQNALASLDAKSVVRSIARHTACDWGVLEDEDRHANEQALTHGSRLFSVYRDQHGTRFYIITEADRTITTILLPEDY